MSSNQVGLNSEPKIKQKPTNNGKTKKNGNILPDDVLNVLQESWLSEGADAENEVKTRKYNFH